MAYRNPDRKIRRRQIFWLAVECLKFCLSVFSLPLEIDDMGSRGYSGPRGKEGGTENKVLVLGSWWKVMGHDLVSQIHDTGPGTDSQRVRNTQGTEFLARGR